MTRVALAAGGTPGHVYPAIAVAAELKSRGAEVVFIGTASGRERELLRGERLEILPGRPYHRTTLWGRAAALAIVPAGIAAAALLLRRERIDAAIGFGGYASVAPLFAARLLEIPTAILEPNAILGMANRLLAHVVDRVYTGTITGWESARSRRTGLPVRSEIIAAARTRSTHGGRPRVLLFDDDLAIDRDVDVIHASELADVAGGYAACDLVVARGGAGTLAEIAICALPSIIMPLDDAAEDHQTRNAAAFAASGAAVIARSVPQMNERLQELIGDAGRREAMGRCAATLAAPDAAKDLVDDVMRAPQ